MKANLQKFKIASEFAPIHIIFTDTNGVILYANKAVEEVTGYTRQEIIGNNPRLWGRQMGKRFYKKFWKTIKINKKIFEGEINNKRKNGEDYIAHARITPVLDGKKLIGFVGIERDITKEKQVDTAKTEFVSLASHQLKNPLSVINLYADALSKEKVGKLNEKQKKYMQSINRASKKMNTLITDLLNVTKIEVGKFINDPKKVKLSEIIKSVIKEFMPKIEEKKIVYEEKCPGDKTKIIVDPKLLTVIVQNLLSNAVKYTPDFGKISLEVSVVEKNLFLKVSDTGYGIPKSQQSKIFNKLYRATNVQEIDQEGSGIGLYMVRSILGKLRGRIWFESKENKGTIFYVKMPVSDL